MRVINRSLSERGGNAASVHVVQVLVLLAVEDVVVDDLEASEARARRGPPMAYGVFSEFAERYRRGRHAHGLLVLRSGATSWGTPHDEGPPETTYGVGSWWGPIQLHACACLIGRYGTTTLADGHRHPNPRYRAGWGACSKGRQAAHEKTGAPLDL